MEYFLYFLIAFCLSVFLIKILKPLAEKKLLLDIPKSPRKIHNIPIPYLGSALILSFLTTLVIYLLFKQKVVLPIPTKFFFGIILGSLILLVGGFLDDKYDLKPKYSFAFPALACLVIVMSGIGVGITEISNPFGNPINIAYKFSLYNFYFSIPALLIWLWLMGMIYTTKFLDGLDGLCSGISLIGGMTLFALSLTDKINQPVTASLAIIFCGSILGFLIYNFNPAKVFLGESGSTFLGFFLGVLAIILGGKIATAVLVMGIPILDVAWAIVRRLWYKQSPFKADRSHLHHRLLDIGLSQKQAVLTLYALSAGFGFTAVFLQSMGKLIALIALFCVMIGLALSVVIIFKRQHPHIPDLFDN